MRLRRAGSPGYAEAPGTGQVLLRSRVPSCVLPEDQWWNCSDSVEPDSAVVEDSGLTAVLTASK